MNALRRAIGRKEVILGLLFSLLAGGWFGWRFLVHPASGFEADPVGAVAQIRDLLDAGKYSEAVARADALLAAQPDQESVFRYKAIAQLLSWDPAGALRTSETALGTMPTGADRAVILAIKALVLTGQEYQQIPAAKAAALEAFDQAGADPEAVFLSRLACAAAWRAEVDQAPKEVDVTEQALRIREALEPAYPAGSAEPRQAWVSIFWRRGLALLVDSGLLAAGPNPSGEVYAMGLLQRFCPQDVWGCYLQIPERALRCVRSPVTGDTVVDDHARIAIYTAAGFLYTQAGDRPHCDALFRRAIRCYVDLLNNADDWSGERMSTVTPNAQFRTVGAEFYTYRNRVELLAKYSADWWGMRVVDGAVTLQDALAACDYKIFRALVRLRADRTVSPGQIAAQEYLRPDFMETLAAWLEKFPYEPQAAWERERASLLRQLAGERNYVNDVLRQVAELADPAAAKRDISGSVGLLREALNVPLTTVQDRIRLRDSLANLLMEQRQYTDALLVLDEILQDMEQPDPYVGSLCPCDTSGVLRRKYQALFLGGQRSAAIALAESVIADAQYADDLHLLMLKDLVVLYAYEDAGTASGVLSRIREYPLRTSEDEALRQRLLRIGESVVQRASRRGVVNPR